MEMDCTTSFRREDFVEGQEGWATSMDALWDRAVEAPLLRASLNSDHPAFQTQ